MTKSEGDCPSRFNGFGTGWQTVETVRIGLFPFFTGLKPRC